jgi:hypothetical protein
VSVARCIPLSRDLLSTRVKVPLLDFFIFQLLGIKESSCSDLKEPTINVFWMVQTRYIPMLYGNESLMFGGFLARCLAFNGEAEYQELTGNEPAISSKLAMEFYKRIQTLFVN